MMKHLYTKFLLGYVIFGVLGFFVIAFFSSHLTEQYLLRSTGEKLYNEAYLLAEECVQFYGDIHPDLESLEATAPHIEAITDYMGGRAWLMDRQGKIIYDSALRDTGHVLQDFNPADAGKRHFTVGKFYDHFSQDQVTVYAPISGSYQIRGYVLLHLPKSIALESRDDMLNVVYLTGAILFALSLILLIFFHVLVYRPLKKVTAAAAQFAQGHLDHRCDLKSEDEMGYLAQTLNFMASELSKTEEFQRKFISNVSHDFRSPLTSIKGYLEAMIDGTIPPEFYEKYMKLVINETERLTKLTQSTLALQSLNSRGKHLDLSSFDINQVIKDTAAAFEAACRPKRITFDLTFSARNMMVQADMGKIQQVLYNLIDNAIKFSHNDSVIWLETYERYDKVFVTVRDTGIGIPKESQQKVWERFYKTDLSRGKDKKGTGLGLAIVKEIIQAHGQNIDIISTVGVGTEFIFTLPKAGE